MKRVGLFIAAVLCIVWLGASAQAQSVVVNKYQNSGTTTDIVELLVVQDNLDMRGMIIKDFSNSMASDGGGKFQFSNDALWSSVRAGTLIVLRNTNSAADTSVGGSDYNLDLGLQNTTYFSNLGGSFDIATTEMVMIKAAGSGAAGVTSSIHALAGGSAGAQFTSAPVPKLRATGTSGSGQFVYANNSTQSLADFNGTDATGAVAAGVTFGSGNNASNTAYINSLRAASVVREPTVQASNVSFSAVGSTSLTVNWTSGNGSARLVQIRESGPVNSSPVDGTSYPASGVFGNGAQTGAGDFVVYAGGGSSVNVTGLKPNTLYYVAVSEFNGAGNSTDYLTTSPATGNQNTVAAYSIRGHVEDSTGVILSGVNIALTGGPATLNATTDYSGNYIFSNLTAGVTYTATPSMTFYSFTPQSQTVKDLSNDEIFNFIATSSAPQDCTYSISPQSQNFATSGGAGNIAVTTGARCLWKARANVDWIKLSDTDGYGSANISYSVSANSSTSARTATIDVQGLLVNITQDAAAASCAYSITPATDSFGPEGGAGSVNVTTTSGCAWTAVSNAAWLTISGSASGAGNGTIAYTVAPNTGFFRTGTLTVGGQTLTLEQKGDGTAPVSTSVHLTMGNPSNAVTDVNQPLNYLLDKPQYAVSYNRDNGRPNWVSWHLNSSWIGSVTRQNDFRNDTSLPSGWYQVMSTDYTGSGFDRGHHTPSADRTATVEDNSATFYMTNMMPQAPDNNQGPWEVLESYTRTLVGQGNEVYIIAGGTGIGGTGSNGGVTNTVANGHVTVPAQTWKVIIVIPNGDNDVSRVNTQTRVIAVIMPNQQGIRTNDWKSYRVSVDQVEALTGYDFFSNVPVNIQSVIEARVDNQ